MNIYKMPFEFEHEEKIFGGYISLRQMIYLLFAGLSIGIIFLPILSAFLKIVIISTIVISMLCFAFLSINSISADKYFTYIFKYLVRKKKYE